MDQQPQNPFSKYNLVDIICISLAIGAIVYWVAHSFGTKNTPAPYTPCEPLVAESLIYVPDVFAAMDTNKNVCLLDVRTGLWQRAVAESRKTTTSTTP